MLFRSSALLAAQCRYESAILLPIVGLVAVSGRRSLPIARAPIRLGLVPLLILSVVWQRLLTTIINGTGSVDALFSWAYLQQNLVRAARFFSGVGDQPYPVSVSILALALLGLGILVWNLPRYRATGNKVAWTLALSAAAFVAGTTVIQCLFYLGDLSEPHMMREIGRAHV